MLSRVFHPLPFSGLGLMSFATKMQAGVTKNTKDSDPKRLGIKKFGGEWVGYNKILVRQRGFKWRPGANVFVGKDHTIHSASEGYVYHEWDSNYRRTLVNIVPASAPPKVHLPKRVFCYHPELYPDRAIHNPSPTSYPIHRRTKNPLVQKQVYKGVPLSKVAYREVPIQRLTVTSEEPRQDAKA